MPYLDLEPAARQVAELIQGIPEAALTSPTPCPAYTLGDLVDHVGDLAVAFTGAATKAAGPTGSQPPPGDASRLTDDWRKRIPRDLLALALAWRRPAAWSGMTAAGGIEMPGEVAGLVALDELVVHGWDVARATDRGYTVEPEVAEVLSGLVSQFADPNGEAGPRVPFGPPIKVDNAATPLERLIGLTGRNPAWSPGET
jgi:uncharacterized protein (TIGR03086 family)